MGLYEVGCSLSGLSEYLPLLPARLVFQTARRPYSRQTIFLPAAGKTSQVSDELFKCFVLDLLSNCLTIDAGLQGMPTGTIEGINFFHLPGHPHNTMCLEEAGVAEADAIIIGPADDLNAKEVSAFHIPFSCSPPCHCPSPGRGCTANLGFLFH